MNRFNLLVLVLLAAATPLWGQAATQTEAVGPLKISVLNVQPICQFRPDSQSKWKMLAAGAALSEGVEFRTGPKGEIQFTVGTDQVYRVDRLTVVKILRANLGPDGTIRTDVGMEYGRVSKDVDSPVRPHEDTIVSPSSTLAVRGTRVSLYDQPPFEPEAISLTGAAVFTALGRQLSSFGAKNGGMAVVTAANTDAASNAINSHLVDPSTANARTAAEQRLVPDVISNGQVNTVSNPVTLPVVSNTGVPTTAQLSTLYSGSLIFYVRWDTNTHVQMELSAHGGASTVGEFLYPVEGLNRSPAGGQLLFDNLGGPTGGYEVITYPSTFPTGEYFIAANNVGNVATTVTFDAFVNTGNGKGLVAQSLQSPDQLNDPTLGVSQEVQISIPAHSSDGVGAPVPEPFQNNIFGGGGFPGGFAANATKKRQPTATSGSAFMAGMVRR